MSRLIYTIEQPELSYVGHYRLKKEMIEAVEAAQAESANNEEPKKLADMSGEEFVAHIKDVSALLEGSIDKRQRKERERFRAFNIKI